MRRGLAVLALLVTPACNRGYGWDYVSTDSIDPDPAPLACLCVDTPPATYTGPSNFWMGLIGGEPDCPAATPLQGLEGFLLQPSLARQYTRECRITPSDTCGIEGKVCAPAPDPDYQTCIHHTDDAPCPSEYPHKHLVEEAASSMLLTLCCQPSPIAG